MKTTKTFICVFFATFLIGYVFVPSAKKEVTVSFEAATKIIETLPPPIETKSEPEILEENNDWKEIDDSKFKVKLLETGEGFHGDEIEVQTGETWLALLRKNNNYFLRSTKITIRSVNDPIIDEPNEKTGKSVSIKGNSQPIFLIKNAKEFVEGEIKTLFWNNLNESEETDPTSLDKNFVREYSFGDKKYLLKVKKGINKKGEEIIALVLEGDNKSQVLHSSNIFEESYYLGSLYWVGDLDHDKIPDFYLSLHIHDNVEYKNLFISSPAKKGKLVKKIATFTTTGC